MNNFSTEKIGKERFSCGFSPPQSRGKLSIREKKNTMAMGFSGQDCKKVQLI